MENSEFESIFRSEFPEIELKYDALTNTYSNKEAQVGWRMWQIHDQKTEEMLEAKQDYVCDCGFLDHVDVIEVDEDELEIQLQHRMNDQTSCLIDRANTFGLPELLNEVDVLGFPLGKKLDRKKILA